MSFPKPEDLDQRQRASYSLWRALGLSESSAMNALVEDGVLRVPERDQFVGTFRELGLSESAAETAARGRERPSSLRSASESSRSSWRPEPGDALTLVARIQKEADSLVGRGVEETTALRESVYAAVSHMPTAVLADWVAAVAGRRWPALYGGSSSVSSGEATSI